MHDIHQASGGKFRNTLCVNSSYQSKEIFNHASLLAVLQGADEQTIIKLFCLKPMPYIFDVKTVQCFVNKRTAAPFCFPQERKGLVTRF